MKATLLAVLMVWSAACDTALAANGTHAGAAPTAARAPLANAHPGLASYPSSGADPLAAAVARPGLLLLLPLTILALAWSQRRRDT